MKNVDERVGTILRRKRIEAGHSQQSLAKLVGITFQQVQKYEKGVNSLNSRRLVEFARVLKFPVAEFFKDEPIKEIHSSERETLEMIKAFQHIKSYAMRKTVSDLARSVAGI